MQDRLRNGSGELVELNEARLRFMFDALEQAREWLHQEALHPSVTAVRAERPGENLAAQYAFALGQVDLMVCNAIADAVFGSGDLFERVTRLREASTPCSKPARARAIRGDPSPSGPRSLVLGRFAGRITSSGRCCS